MIKLSENLDKNTDPKFIFSLAKNIKNKKSRVLEPLSSNVVNMRKVEDKFESLTDRREPTVINDYLNYKDRFLVDLSDLLEGKYTFMIKDITFEELNSALLSFKTKSSPGPDNISFKVLKNLPRSALIVLLKIFNMIIKNNDIPTNWRSFFTVFIPKPGSDDCRPISLASYCMELFEKILLRRLEWWSENEKIIPSFQYGFRKGKSTTDAVLDLTTFVQINLINKNLVGTIYLDIKGAFDNVDPYVLAKLLLRLKCPKPFVLLIYNLIKVRNIQALVNGKMIGSRMATCGLPQGSVLSPNLFNTS